MKPVPTGACTTSGDVRAKKRKKPTKTALTRKADKLWSEQIRARGYCQLQELAGTPCGGPHQACHVLGRRYRSTRWSLDNGLCGCRDHHMVFTIRPEGFVLAVQKKWPGLYEDLWARAQVQWHGRLEDEISALLDAQDAPR